MSMKRVGIIGGGISGLGAAWLLDEECEVILFEKRNYLGGHAHSTYVETEEGLIPIETGFEFFNNDIHPHLFRLLDILQIATRPYPFTYTFFSEQKNSAYILPPIQNGKILWRMFTPRKLPLFLQLKYVLDKSSTIVKNKNTESTLEQFLDNLWVTDSFKNDFFFPLFCAGWGATPNDFKKFSTYNLFSWEIDNKSMGLTDCYWDEIITGVSSYIDALSKQINRATIHTNASILNISYDSGKYTISQDNGNVTVVDQLIVATNAYEAHNLLKGIPEMHELNSLLNQLEHIKAILAIHGDIRFMPPCKSDWSIANVYYNGIESALTTYKPWKSKIPLFRSWIMPGFPEPEPLYSSHDYYYAKITPHYFETQRALRPLQGRHNLWLAGIYTHGIDSHESALVSAMKIAKKLAPDSQRYKLLCGNGHQCELVQPLSV